jgi:hypothetical protein
VRWVVNTSPGALVELPSDSSWMRSGSSSVKGPVPVSSALGMALSSTRFEFVVGPESSAVTEASEARFTLEPSSRVIASVRPIFSPGSKAPLPSAAPASATFVTSRWIPWPRSGFRSVFTSGCSCPPRMEKEGTASSAASWHSRQIVSSGWASMIEELPLS